LRVHVLFVGVIKDRDTIDSGMNGKIVEEKKCLRTSLEGSL
jgi:hypothetical protein